MTSHAIHPTRADVLRIARLRTDGEGGMASLRFFLKAYAGGLAFFLAVLL